MSKRSILYAGAALAAVLAFGSAVVVAHRSSASGNQALAVDANGVRNESVPQVQHLIAQGALVLDVRTDKEWTAGHLEGAVHIPLAQVAGRASELPKGRTIVAVCHEGGRSYQAAYALRHLGYDAVNLAGGLKAWVSAGLPVVDGTGSPGKIL